MNPLHYALTAHSELDVATTMARNLHKAPSLALYQARRRTAVNACIAAKVAALQAGLSEVADQADALIDAIEAAGAEVAA